MAVTSQPVVSDLGSEELTLLRKEFNKLLDEIDGAADFAALKTAVAANLRKIVATLELPDRPKFPMF